MTECPKDFIGDTELAKWLNKLRRFVVSIQPIESSEVAVERSHRGSALFAKGGGKSTTSSSGMNYRGTYNPPEEYLKGDVVRQQAPGSSQGVWVCVLDNPGQFNQPTFPEPSTQGGNNYWEMLTFGVQAASVCAGGSKTIYINSTPPI